jgi:hypothetical protein
VIGKPKLGQPHGPKLAAAQAIYKDSWQRCSSNVWRRPMHFVPSNTRYVVCAHGCTERPKKSLVGTFQGYLGLAWTMWQQQEQKAWKEVK